MVRLRLLDFIDVIADVTVEAEFHIGSCGKLVTAQVHSMLRPVRYRVVHEFLYATSLPHQPKVRVGIQSAGIDTDEVIHRLFRLPILIP